MIIVKLPITEEGDLIEMLESSNRDGYQKGYADGANYVGCGCEGCAFSDVEPWEMPCTKCKRGCRDYYRKEKKEKKPRGADKGWTLEDKKVRYGYELAKKEIDECELDRLKESIDSVKRGGLG